MGSASLETGDSSLLLIAILQNVSKDARLEDFVWRVALVGGKENLQESGLAEGSKIMEAGPEMEYLDPQPLSL